MMPGVPTIRVAVIDLYNGETNQGMRCIRELLEETSRQRPDANIEFDVFDIRARKEIPGLGYDAYISSGGPGSPYEGVGKAWEKLYFNWMRTLWAHNQKSEDPPKHAFFICHSFQMMCRFFHLGDVARRRSQSFGIFPVHKTEAGRSEPVFEGLADPFYAADFRNWQVVQPDVRRIRDLGASILAYEKIRPHVELERGVMAIRLTPEIIGVQFHPEADARGMLIHFSDERRREAIIDDHGEKKYERIIHRLKDPDYLDRTHRTVLTSFLRQVIGSRLPEAVSAAD